MTYYLAVDIGASSGRHILAHLEEGKIILEEIYRFENGIEYRNGTAVWNIENLFNEVKNGLAQCKKLGKIPSSVAIDTWGVDYVLIDRGGKDILPVVAYRDNETSRLTDSVFSLIPKSELYSSAGIQFQPFNTLFQLYRDKINGKTENAADFLMIPDYLSYRLTGVVKHEYTNASTTNLLNANAKTWDKEIIKKLGLKEELFGEISLPSSAVGCLKKEIADEMGFDTMVLLAPSHDTASAVAACPIDENCVYLSSGTWSLIGTENTEAVLTEEAMKANFTNEGGVEYRFRFLKNIMGMWLFQNIRKNLSKKFTYDEMMRMAQGSSYTKTFDCNDPSLTAPENMIEAVKKLLGEDLPVEDVLSSVYHSLAFSYKNAVEEIEKLTGKKIEKIMIVGGGSKDVYLNELTAKLTGKTVLTGLTEATALGNVASQIMADKKINLTEVRQIIRNSFDFKETRV